jgi:hypothetical protein
LEDASEAANEYCDTAYMLHDYCGVGDQSPELVGLETWISLEMVEECVFISVVVRVFIVE